jgi:hypothetical protein
MSGYSKLLIVSSLALVAAAAAFALPPEPPGSKGVMTMTYTLKTTVKEEVLDFDGKGMRTTIVDQTGKITCPVETYGVDATSYLDGASAGQTETMNQFGAAAKKEVEAIKPSTIQSMESLKAEFEACQRSGKSEQVCGMAMMAKMNSDPALMQALGAMGMADPNGMAAAEEAVAASTGRFQVWHSESCTGTLTANNVTSVVGARGTTTVTDKVTGSRPIAGETNITVETDMNKSSSRYAFVPGEASGFSRVGVSGKTSATLATMPDTVFSGPLPGPIKNGRHETKLPGGTLTIDWTFQRQR